MADSFKNLLFGFILTSLFAVLIISGVVYEGQLYGKDTGVITSGLSYLELNQSISTVESTSQNVMTAFEKQSIWSTIAGIVVTGIFDITKSLLLMITLPFTIFSGIMVNVLHIPKIVSSVILGLILLSAIFGIWRLLKQGD